jgi:N-acetylmuramic acid 6-phosphate etherase
MVEITKLVTEQRNPNTTHLDEMTSLEIAQILNQEDQVVITAVKNVLPQVAQAIDVCAQAIAKGARIIYIGAGTSGRLGLLDAAEVPPTFGLAADRVIGILAGGNNAFFKAIEDIEDSEAAAVRDLDRVALTSDDVVLAVAASGRTPYCIAGLKHANKLGAYTIAFSNNPMAKMSEHADLAIEALTGPEVLTGSTRLKAGTAQKMILNMISTGSMILNGKVYQNLMVDVQQTNEKLAERARRIVMEATGCSYQQATDVLKESSNNVKIAILMILNGLSYERAKENLALHNGFIRTTNKEKGESK